MAENPDFLARLRGVEAQFPLSATAGILGAVLLGVGAVWASLSLLPLLRPSLLLLLTGAACLAASVASRREGVLAFCSIDASSLGRSLFDVVYDDSPLQNWLRRWGRVLMLCQERSAGEVRMIVEGLDPDFLDWVFRWPFVRCLPRSFSRLLLPEDPPASGAPEEVHCRHAPEAGAPRVTPEEIMDVVRGRILEQQQSIMQPPLTPVLVGTLMVNAVHIWKGLMKTGLGAAVLGGGIWWTRHCLRGSPLLLQLPRHAQGSPMRAFGALGIGAAALTMAVLPALGLPSIGLLSLVARSERRDLETKDDDFALAVGHAAEVAAEKFIGEEEAD